MTTAATCLACGSTRDAHEEQRLTDLVAELRRTLAIRDRQVDTLREVLLEATARAEGAFRLAAAVLYQVGERVTITKPAALAALGGDDDALRVVHLHHELDPTYVATRPGHLEGE
jgi:hypothetical protein